MTYDRTGIGQGIGEEDDISSIVGQDFWETRHRRQEVKNYSDYRSPLDPLLQSHLPRSHEKRIIEVGCVPGGNLVYFSRQFGYRVAGIDYSEAIAGVANLLRAHDVEDFELYRRDLFCFEPERLFDVVFSAGVVEHFEDPGPVFDRHYQLLAPGGHLVITIPHMRTGQALIRRLLRIQREFRWHNLEVKRPEVWRSLARRKGLEILYCDYWRTFGFWLPEDSPVVLRRAMKTLAGAVIRLLAVLRLDNIPNRYLSPQVVLLARKPDPQEGKTASWS